MMAEQGTNRQPTWRSRRTLVTEHGIPYGGRPLGQRRLRSTPRMGKPCTWGRESGTSVDRRGGMQNAGNYNLTVDYPGTWSTRAATAAFSALRVITSSMRGNSMTTLAGGPREPRAWKLASVVRGGAVGKGLYSSTSLAAYSTLAARVSIFSAAA